MDEVSRFDSGVPLLSDPAPAIEPHPATWDRPRALRLRGAAPGEDVRVGSPLATVVKTDPSGELDGAGGRSQSEPGPVVIDSERGAPVLIRDHYGAVITGCLERMAMLSRLRDERPLYRRAGIEARLLAQVDAVVEARVSVPDLLAFWDDAARDDPRVTWAIVFMLGSLAGGTAITGILDLVNGLAADEEEHAILVAEALVAAPHPDRVTLGRDLLRSARPLARTIAVELLSRLGQLGMEPALAALDDQHVAVKAAALRALARMDGHNAMLPKIRACLGHGDPAVVCEAARTLTLFGATDVYLSVRERGALSEMLGPYAVEILALAGNLDDIAVMETLIRRQSVSAETLSALARFGHPAAWPYLVHALERSELADAAERALVTLFGPLVIDEPEDAAGVWRGILARTEFPAGTRLRKGERWSARAVIAECAGGELSRREVELLHDELRVRTRRRAHDLGAWWSPGTIS
jgi:HEAT repeat protein